MIKINFSNPGKKEHFYMLVPDKGIRIYKKRPKEDIISNPLKNDSSSKLVVISDIKKFTYGIASDNLRKRFKNMKNSKLRSPWLFFSILTKKRSIDLYMDDVSLNKWFYGLKYLIEEKYLKIKIKSTTEYVLTRMKLRMITELKELTDNDIGNQHKSLLVLTQLRNFAQTNYFGFENLSFLKVLLLYVKVKKIKTNI